MKKIIFNNGEDDCELIIEQGINNQILITVKEDLADFSSILIDTYDAKDLVIELKKLIKIIES
jgi:hypothetical protein